VRDIKQPLVGQGADAREQVVFDLGGQSECHVEPEQRYLALAGLHRCKETAPKH